MKVAFVYLHPFSESMGSAVRVRELAFSLAKLGVEVYVLDPYEQSFDLAPSVHVVSTSGLMSAAGLSKALYGLSKRIYYSKAFSGLFSKNGPQSDKLLSGLVRGMTKAVEHIGVDLVQVEQDVAIPLGLGLGERTGLPVVADVHNVTSEELVAAGVLKRRSGGFAALQTRLRECLLGVDRVAVVSECMRDYVVGNYGLRSASVCVVPPGGRLSADKSVVDRRIRPVKAVYAGLVAYRERVDLFVRSMPFVKSPGDGVQFYITNKGESVDEIRKLARRLGASPAFFWYDDYATANRFISSCHVGVLPSSDDEARRMGTPAKLFNYMSVGLPVVANNIGGWSEMIEKERVGVLTSDDPEEFGVALGDIGSDPEAMRECALNGLELIETKYNWDNSARVLLEAYEQLAGQK